MIRLSSFNVEYHVDKCHNNVDKFAAMWIILPCDVEDEKVNGHPGSIYRQS